MTCRRESNGRSSEVDDGAVIEARSILRGRRGPLRLHPSRGLFRFSLPDHNPNHNMMTTDAWLFKAI